MTSEAQRFFNNLSYEIRPGSGNVDRIDALSPSKESTHSLWPLGQIYCDRGWSIIPIKAMSKQPLISAWKQYQTRRPSEAEISLWRNQHPQANVAVICGAVSGLVVLDVDSDDGWRYLKANGCFLPPTPRAESSPGKAHIYFRHPGGVVKNMIRKLPGIDIKGDGGYVVAPPSVHPSGATYRWLDGFAPVDVDVAPCPEWLLELIDRGEVAPPEDGEVPADGRVVLHDPELVDEGDWVGVAMMGVESGLRNSTCAKLAGYYLGQAALPKDRVKQILLAWNMLNRPPMPVTEINATVDSIARAEAARRIMANGILPRQGRDDTAEELSEAEKRLSMISHLVDRLGLPIQRIYAYAGDRKQYVLVIGGVDLVVYATDLNMQSRFRQKLMDVCGVVLSRYKPKDWDNIVQCILNACETITTGEEATVIGQLKGYVAEYLTEVPPTDVELDSQDILNTGRPMFINNQAHISLPVIRKHLMDTKMFVSPDGSTLAQLLTRIGCKAVKVWVQPLRRQIRLWQVPGGLWNEAAYLEQAAAKRKSELRI